MTLQISLHTTEYRGDHAADVVIAQETIPAESVLSLAERLLVKKHNDDFGPGPSAWIEIRVEQPPKSLL